MSKKWCSGANGLNRDTQSCCKQHDVDYSTGQVPRIVADTDLLICVAYRGMPWRAIAMFIAVRLFGWIFYKGRY